MQRRQLFFRQQQHSSPLGSALFETFSIKLLKHIASYLAKPSQALFAVSLGNFDMSSLAAMSTATNRIGGHKRNSDGSLRYGNVTICLADIPAEPLTYVASFLPGYSQALFGLAIAATNDEVLNKNSFAIVGDRWESLDFGEIEKELAMRLTDDDIKAVLLCIDAANKVKRLSLAHCVNITGTCLEPLHGSTVIEKIDLSLVGRHEAPILRELTHPPQMMDFPVCAYDPPLLYVAFDPPLSYEIVLPILDSIIEGEQCSLQHLQFPKAWRTNYQLTGRFDYLDTFKPNPAFMSFLSRYNQFLMNRGRINCVNCSRDLPSSGYELVGSSVNADDMKSFVTFGYQNQTCSQCMKHYCYCCDDVHADEERQFRNRCYGYFSSLERCEICEREECVECSGMYKCEHCSKIYCMGCKEVTECPSECGRKICSDCNFCQCHKCKKGCCQNCSLFCSSCRSDTCEECNDFIYCSKKYCSSMECNSCASEHFEACQKCKELFCFHCTSTCQSCNQTFCEDCVTFRQCINPVPGRDHGCSGNFCVDCPDEPPFVDLARTCAECNKQSCDVCKESMAYSLKCVRCFRTSCKTWQTEKKKLMDDQLNESRKVSSGARA